ncbi:MAG TPA: DMT family transporter [Nocardioidaceae bacterium]|nr:DMT family transporter [Nocardioidaceae bacterium]
MRPCRARKETQLDLPLSATLMVLTAAVAHATWNAIAHDISDKVVAFVLLGLGGMIGALCVLVLASLPRAEAWPYLLASVVMHVVYTMLLMTSYRLGDFSQVYPLARGTSPLIVTALAAVFIGEVPSLVVLIGVVVISAGLASLMLAGGVPSRKSLPAVCAALATGLSIATYSTIDGAGVRASGTAAGYTGWLILLESGVLVAYALVRRGPALASQVRPHLWIGIFGGVLSVGAYGLVLWAQTRGALAPIAALRESSIIVGALIGTVFFHERFGRPRVIATAVVFVGIVLVVA